jgi:hypothetical protein
MSLMRRPPRSLDVAALADVGARRRAGRLARRSHRRPCRFGCSDVCDVFCELHDLVEVTGIDDCHETTSAAGEIDGRYLARTRSMTEASCHRASETVGIASIDVLEIDGGSSGACRERPS